MGIEANVPAVGGLWSSVVLQMMLDRLWGEFQTISPGCAGGGPGGGAVGVDGKHG